ncbi:uncharacterized protein LOC110814704 isoform X1 [Carica papaya]|uniref:uncharacterized protein LOC110814704 isoform X1 n=1 Tax=Carica papaya TaxID=3649 RepID=UPI000B8CB0C7|nr:uncharacterized protein LOC110814704 isoform X1 [Carica papaya]
MGTLGISLSLSLLNGTHHLRLAVPISSRRLSLRSFKSAKPRTSTLVFGENPSDPKEPMFVDEDGVVDDMEGYLNYLSLEYDSVWDTKPAWDVLEIPSYEQPAFCILSYMVTFHDFQHWYDLFPRCQPWTITLTGVSAIACSWLILHSLVVTSAVILLIGIWWYIFLYSYPKVYSDMIAERRKRVTNGVEDIYGWKKTQ